MGLTTIGFRLAGSGALAIWTISGMPARAADSPAATVSEKITIEQAVAEATEANLDLLAGRANIAVAEARVITAGLKPNPVLTVAADHLDVLGTGFNPDNGGGAGRDVCPDGVCLGAGREARPSCHHCRG